MKREWRRFASAGLYLSMLAGLAAIVLYIIQREWNLYLQISVGLVVIGLALFAVLDPERVRVILSGRQAKYGSNALVMTVAFVGIVVVVNYLGSQNSKRWDLTEDKQNTLAPETLDTLKNLPQPVEAMAFFTARTNSDQAKSLLQEYKFSSNGKFDYKFIDPEADPIAAQAANITRDGTIVLKMGDRQEPVTLVQEKEITAGLVRLISTKSQAVYFLTGHGEHDINGTDTNAYAKVKSTLVSKNYKVASLNLLSENKIPDDAKVIVIAGPKKPVSAEEVSLLETFLANGGSLVVMEEPIPLTDFGDAPDPLANYLADTWGISLGKDIVVDLSSQQPFVAVANQYGSHAIVQKLQGLVTFFPTARSVQKTKTVSGFTQTELVFTSTNSWAETNLKDLQDQSKQITPDQGVDLMGPVPIALVGENSSNKNRIVVFGDSDFVSDANFDQYGNGDLFINSIDWAAEQENLINLTPKQPTQRVLIPPQRYTMGLVLFGSVFFLPGIVLVAGIFVWAQRRRRV